MLNGGAMFHVDSEVGRLRQVVLHRPGLELERLTPDSNLARYLNRGGPLRTRTNDPAHRRMRRKLRDPAGRATYTKRKAIIEPVYGVLKEQRGMRRFRKRGLAQVAVEWALATTAYNLTRMWRTS